MFGDGVQHVEVIDVAAIPASDGSFRQGQIVVSDDQFRIKNWVTPKPSQLAHAPAGLLNENILGSSSVME